MTQPLLELQGISKHFPVKKGLIRQKVVGTVRAVDEVSFKLMPGETLAIVGESGCVIRNPPPALYGRQQDD